MSANGFAVEKSDATGGGYGGIRDVFVAQCVVFEKLSVAFAAQTGGSVARNAAFVVSNAGSGARKGVSVGGNAG